jgi:uncharacterized protein (TIGR02145 family)
LLFFSIATFSQVGIGTTTPDGSAKLDVSSTTKGFLPPRLTTTQRNEINSPAIGLMIYNTTIGAIQFYTGTSWITANYAFSDTSLLNLTTRFSQVNANVNSKMTLSDTSLLNLTTRFSQVMTLSDTSLLNLTTRFSHVNANVNSKMMLSDTSLLNLTTRFSQVNTNVNNKLNITDTSTMLSGYLRKADTASLSDRINAKLSKTDTASLSDRINAKLNSTVFPYYPGLQKGHIMYWNGSIWVNLNPGTAGQVLKMSSAAEPVPVWGTDATTSTPAFSPCGTTISDIDGNSYNTVLIGTQCWTKENLRVRRYNNGTAIQFDAIGGSGGSSSTWQNLEIGAHTIYANDSTTTPSNRTKYGYLYNWYAAKGIYTTGTITSTDTLNICPSGWHVPTDAEWTTLTDELGGYSVAGGTMKSVRTAYWKTPNTGATNESGFSALPGGGRNNDGSFINIGSNAFFWSATEHDYDDARYRTLANTDSSVSSVINYKTVGASVRCIRD